MANKNWIMIKRGLSEDAKHRESMGNRIWLYMHIIDRADWPTGRVFDWRDRDEADDMGINWRTLQQQRQELQERGYIFCEQNGNGQTIIIKNWVSPRNYSGEIINPKGTENYVPKEEEGTSEGTVAPNSNLRTPSMSIKNQVSTPRKRETKEQNPDLLITTVPHGEELQIEFTKAFESKGRKAPMYFENIQQKEGYSDCATALNGKFIEAVKHTISRGRTARGDILSSLRMWVQNEKKSNVKGDSVATKPTGQGGYRYGGAK